jgi:hypothetical protein
MMKNFKEESSEHIFRLLYVVRNAANYRSLDRHEFNQSYWIIIFNNFYDMAILEWCKIFGTDNEPTHWKALVSDSDCSSFRNGLLKRIGLDESGWQSYWKEIRDYRNNALAHHRKSPMVTRYPPLDNVLQSAFYYHGWLVKQLEAIGIIEEPNNLEAYYNSYIRQAKLFLERAYESTKNIREDISFEYSEYAP